MAFEDLFRSAIGGAVMSLEAASAAVILLGAVLALVALARRHDWAVARDRFSHTLLFALDFTIGADVLKVAIAPDLGTVSVVGAVVAVRIALTLALVWELSRRLGGDPVSSAAPSGTRART